MERDDRTWFDDDETHEEFVPAVNARNADEAQRYRDLLEDHDIPVLLSDEMVDEEGEPVAARGGISRSVTVLVPEEFLDEASEIIADCQDSTDLLDEDEPAEDEDEDDEFDFADNLDDEDVLEDLDDDEEDYPDLDEDEDDPDFDVEEETP